MSQKSSSSSVVTNIVWLAFAKALSAVIHTEFRVLFGLCVCLFGIGRPGLRAWVWMAKQLSSTDFLLANRSPVALLPRDWCSMPCQHLHNFLVCKPFCARHCIVHSDANSLAGRAGPLLCLTFCVWAGGSTPPVSLTVLCHTMPYHGGANALLL